METQNQLTPTLEVSGSRQFVSWLHEQALSVAFSTYQTGKLFLVGAKQDGRLSVFERTFERCMGLCATADSQTLWMSSLYQLWRFENALPVGERAPRGYDRLYVPQLGYTTGDIDLHDIGLAQAQPAPRPDDSSAYAGISLEPAERTMPIFVNTLFSCIAAPSGTHSFRPIWKPSFISRLAAEDRCHLNGLAMEDGRARYVTAVSTSDVHEGWREHRRNGGVVVDVLSGEIVCRHLSMPHSPRVHGGVLYVLNSGTGEFGIVEPKSGGFQPICFCPGYARGLALYGGFAIIGLSTCRENRTFSGLELDDALASRNVQARCGLLVIDLKRGDVVHSLTLTGVVRELYDVAVLPGVRMPSALGFKTEEIRRTITIGE